MGRAAGAFAAALRNLLVYLSAFGLTTAQRK
jgi:hypothetical protein